jgi:DNA-binding response OmpR family regulator
VSKLRILIVDDEPSLVKGLKLSLELEGYEVLTAGDGRQGLAAFENGRPDLVVLDLMLPEVDGLTVCRRMREASRTPVIMLTAKADDVDKIVGLEIGADDYMTKPFNTRELMARIRAVLRRVQMERQAAAAGTRGERLLYIGDLEIDIPRRRVRRGAGIIELTPTEFDLLASLAAAPGRVFGRDELLRSIWGYEYIGDDRTVDVHIRRLREKIEPNPSAPVYVQTSWGKGYYAAELGPRQ